MFPPESARRGFPMSQPQLDMLEYLEELVDHFLRAEAVSMESLGRAGEKLSKLASYAFQLSHQSLKFDFQDLQGFLDVLRKSFDSYSSVERPQDSSPEDAMSGLSSVETSLEPQVRMPMQTTSTLRVQASRVKWKLAPSFDPSPFLTDPVVKEAFRNPDFLRRPKDTWPALPKAIVHADKSEILELAGKWDSLDACRVIECSQVASIETVGLFCVPKDAQWDRLILNPTVINSRCFGYSAFTKTLAPGYLITSIQLPPDEKILISSDDLCEFYYTFKVSNQRARRNAIGIRFHGSELKHLKCCDPALYNKDCYVCLGTLAMGDALAVEIAQQSHINLLRTLAGSMRPDEALQYRLPCPRGPFYELLTIDDHIGLQRVKLDHTPDCLQHTRDSEVFKASELAYKQVQLTAHPGKRQRQVDRAIVLGAEVDGVWGRVSAPRTRVAALCFITSVIVRKGIITRKLLLGLIGCWTHVCLFRRPVFAIFDKVYHEGEHLADDVVFKMSSQTMTELLLMCMLSPVMQADLRVDVAPAIYMLDASPGFARLIFLEVQSQSCGDTQSREATIQNFRRGPGWPCRSWGLNLGCLWT